MRYVKVLVVLAVLGAYPAVALAHKAPTKSQRTALVKAFNQAVKTPVAVPSKCLREEISTVNASWAGVEFGFDSKGRLPAVCAKFAANGQVIFHFRAGKWHSGARAATSATPTVAAAWTRKMPRKVITDLDLC